MEKEKQMTDVELVEKACEVSGMSEEEIMQQCLMDSVVLGICRTCHSTQDCEPDADENWCNSCNGQTVVSVSMLLYNIKGDTNG